MRDRKEKDTVWAEISSCGFLRQFQWVANETFSHYTAVWIQILGVAFGRRAAGQALIDGSVPQLLISSAICSVNKNIVNIKVSELIDKS